MRARWFVLLIVSFFGGCKPELTPEEMRQSVRKFMLDSKTISTKNAVEAMDSMLRKVDDSVAFRYVSAVMETALGRPESEYRNDDLYIHLQEARLNTSFYISQERDAIEANLRLTQQNRPGAEANNFSYSLASGEIKTMHDIDADYTLLFFYNPECPACKQMKAALYTDPIVNGRIMEGRLAVLAIYTDSDTVLWRKHLGEMPGNWIMGRDHEERLWKERVYDLRAIPSVYLLDRMKRVILKDCQTESTISEALN